MFSSLFRRNDGIIFMKVKKRAHTACFAVSAFALRLYVYMIVLLLQKVNTLFVFIIDLYKFLQREF